MDTPVAAMGATGVRALLSMAVQEGLLERALANDDGVVDQITSHPVEAWLRDQVLTQLVLTPIIAVDSFNAGTFLAGELFDAGILQRFDPPTLRMSALKGFAIEPVLGVLASRGVDMTPEAFSGECGTLLAESERLNAALQRKGLDQRDSLSGWSAAGATIRLFVDRDPDEEALITALASLHARSAPISQAFDEVARTLDLAERAQCDELFFPRRPVLGSFAATNPASAPDVPAEIAVLRIVTTRLGRLPARSTLRDTLRLSQTSAAADLRIRIRDWADAFVEGHDGTLAMIERDIARAERALSGVQDAAAVSRTVTYLGLPIALASELVGVPPELGLSASIVGTFAEGLYASVRRHFRWASFGNH